MARPEGRVLAVDLGERRIGVATCDEAGIAVRPLGVVSSIGPKRDASAIRSLAEGLEPRLLVVGLPLDLEGEEGPEASRARERGLDLARRLQLPVEFVDESLSTVEARRRLVEAGTSRRRRRVVDADAAAVILETWLSSRAGDGA
jgi:putative Holliday junction resolvase